AVAGVGLDLDASFFAHCLCRILHQIHEDLVQLPGIAIDIRDRSIILDDLHTPLELMLQQGQSALHVLVEICQLKRRPVEAYELLYTLDDGFETSGPRRKIEIRVLQYLQGPLQLSPAPQALRQRSGIQDSQDLFDPAVQQVRRALDRAQGGVDFVDDASDEVADSAHLSPPEQRGSRGVQVLQ